MIDVQVATVYSLDLPDTDDLCVGWKRRFLTKYKAIRAYCAHRVLVRIANREGWGPLEWGQEKAALHDVIVYSHPWRHCEHYEKLYYRYYRFVLHAMKNVGPLVSVVEWRDPGQELPPDLFYPCLVAVDGLAYPAVWNHEAAVFVNAEGQTIPMETVELWAFMPKPARLVPDQMRAALLEAQEWLRHHGGDTSTDDGLRTLLAKLDAVLGGSNKC